MASEFDRRQGLSRSGRAFAGLARGPHRSSALRNRSGGKLAHEQRQSRQAAKPGAVRGKERGVGELSGRCETLASSGGHPQASVSIVAWRSRKFSLAPHSVNEKVANNR